MDPDTDKPVGYTEHDATNDDAPHKPTPAIFHALPITADSQDKNTHPEQRDTGADDNPPVPSTSWLSLHLGKLKHVGLHEWLMLAATIVMAASTFFYTRYARGQLETMKGTLDEMKRSGQSSTTQMWSAIGNLNWTAQSMDYSSKQAQRGVDASSVNAQNALVASERQSKAALDASIATSRNDQRAWIGISSTTTEMGSLNPPNVTLRGIMYSFVLPNEASFSFQSVDISLHNSGRTPAVRIEAECCFVLRRMFSIAEIPDYDIAKKISEEILRTRTLPSNGDVINRISNNQSVQFTSHGGTLPPDVTLPETILDGGMRWGVAIRGLPSTDYVLGKITYHDVFPDTAEHTTTICLIRKAQSRFAICSGGGTMD